MGKSCIFDLKQIFQFDEMMVTNFFGSPCSVLFLNWEKNKKKNKNVYQCVNFDKFYGNKSGGLCTFIAMETDRPN